jgi:alcohol dehydrogenase class IV
MNFEFASAARIVFGPGKIAGIGEIAAGFGQRVLLITGNDTQRAAPVLDALRAAKLTITTHLAQGEPSVSAARTGAQHARDIQAEVVIGFGGGSAIDLGKAIAALATNPGDPLDYLEVIGQGRPLQAAPLPYIAVPTTAGSGAEVTRNAVLASPEHQVKVSLRSPLMLPRVALIDPLLTHSLPRSVTAATGMDALTQLIEPYVCTRATPLTDALCLDGITRAAWALPRVCADGSDTAAREAMALASLFGGMALANSGLGAVHGFAAPIGGMFDAPHGAVCARLLPLVWKVNTTLLQEQSTTHPTLARYLHVARILVGPDASLEDGTRYLDALASTLEIPRFSVYGINVQHIPALVERAAKASSMQANPVQLTPSALTNILESAI